MPSPKTAKVLKKSLTGSALLAVVVLLLFWTDKSANGEPILYVTAALLLGAIVEASRMGSLATRDLFPALVIPVAWAILSLVAYVRGGGGGADLAGVVLFCGALAAAAHAIGQVWRTRNAFTRLVVYALGAVLVAQMGDQIRRCAVIFALVGILPAIVLAFRPNGLRGLAIAAGLAVWIIPPITFLWPIWRSWSTGGLVAFLLCAKVGDTAGYYVGTALGKHHPFPRISPGKTVEGCIGSFVAGAAVGGISAAGGLLSGGPAAGLAAGALVNLAAQAGDLLESWVKRKAGVKDSSGLFGPSGGLLDQLDSLLLAVPVAFLAWPWLVPPSH